MSDSSSTLGRWKQIVGVTLLVLLIALVLADTLNLTASPGKSVTGVVLSTSTVELGRAYGSTHGVANVRLSTGRIVTALVVIGGAPSQGANVTLLERTHFWGGRTYEVISVSP